MKKFFKKQIVSLRRKPQRIPLVLLVICCMIYTFNLTEHSNASLYVNSNVIALYVFVITLLSILTILSYVNAYAGGKKRMATLVVTVVFILLQVLLDVLYLNILFFETVQRENPVPVTRDIAISMNMSMVHIGALVVALAFILLKPLYQRALMKINTTVQDMEESNISDYSSIDEEFPDEDQLD